MLRRLRARDQSRERERSAKCRSPPPNVVTEHTCKILIAIVRPKWPLTGIDVATETLIIEFEATTIRAPNEKSRH